MESPAPSLNTLLERPLTADLYRVSRSIPRRDQWRIFLFSLLLSDVGMTLLAYRLAYAIRFEMKIPVFYLDFSPEMGRYQMIVLLLLPVLITLFAIGGLYERKNLLGGTKEYSHVLNATTIAIFLIVSAGFLDPTFIVARGWVLLAWALTFLMVASGRFMLRRIVHALRFKGFFLAPTLIVGANDEGLSLASQFMGSKNSGLHVLGFVDEKLPAGAPLVNNLHVLGPVSQLDALIEKYKVEELVLASSAISSREKMLEIFKRYGVGSGVNVRLSSGLYEIITTGLSVMEFAYVPLVRINQVRLTGVDRFLKLVLDYAITIPGLLLISPFMLLIAALIRLDSPGPVIHRRRVMGVNGRQFDAYKFRSMHVNGDEILDQYPDLKKELARTHKLKWDPRITKMGEFLRKTSLDELPQLFNVLKREMSLVGPRMITPSEMEMYDQWDLNLLTVQPGITGLWQVSGRSDVSYEQRVRLDMHYIRNWSIWFDLQLLLQTIPAVVKRRGAY